MPLQSFLKYACWATLILSTAIDSRGAVGPRVPVGPQNTILCPSKSVRLSPGEDVQAAVRAHRADATYCFAPGTYARQQITPHKGDRYWGEKGAILDGQNAVAHAFYGGADNVTIENLVIRDYTAPSQDAPINNRKGRGKNWIIKNNEIANNAGAGIEVGDGTQVIANYIHNNRQEGYACGGADVVIEDNEIAFNNPDDAVNPGWEAGGGKCWATTGLLVQYNYSHDNHGPGLWTDTDNRGVTYIYNDVENNWGGGIFHEVSWDALIAHNTVKDNARRKYCPGWLWCSDIQIAASGGVNGKIIDIYDNTVVSDGSQRGNAIGLLQQNRGGGLYGRWLVQNVHVHDNRIDMSAGGATGAVQDNGDEGIFTSQGNSFNANIYTGVDGSSFVWDNQYGDFRWFQKQNQEAHGMVVSGKSQNKR